MRKLTFIIITSVCVLIFAFSSPNPKNYVYIKELKEMTYNDNEYHLNKITLNNQHNATQTLKIKVKKGDSISKVLARNKIKVPEIFYKKKSNSCLHKLKTGKIIEIKSSTSKVLEIYYSDNNISCLYDANTNNFIDKNYEYFHEELVFFNDIKSSFFKSAKDSGLKNKEIMQIADIFGWDIDFALDIRKKDNFFVLLERYYSNKAKYSHSQINFAFFVNKKKKYEFYRYDNSYFDKKGNEIRKQFLKTPLNFTRVSSNFSYSRLHPILKKRRPHLGIDYAAPTGTPVYTTGDGTIIHRGKKGGYGKTVIIRHANKYTTLYAHLSKYRKGQRVGSKVKQKQVIGYVGSTGLSTGPHLHYEFRIRGKHINPKKVKSKRVNKLRGEKYKNFLREIKQYNDKLNWANSIVKLYEYKK